MSATGNKNTVNKTRFTDSGNIDRFVLDIIDSSEVQFNDIKIEIKYQSSIFTDINYVPLASGENNFKSRLVVKLKLPVYFLLKILNSASAYKLPKKILHHIVKKFQESDSYFLKLHERKIIENLNSLLLKFRQISGISEKINSIIIFENSAGQENSEEKPYSELNIECIHEIKDTFQWGINISFTGEIITQNNIPFIKINSCIKVKYFKNYFFTNKIN